MKKIFITAVFCTVCAIGLTPLLASAQVPFGGIVTTIQPCDTGLLAYVKTAFGVLPVMWIAGELPFLSYIPPHPGQWLLGETLAAPIGCFIGPIPYGIGFPIVFHGSSI